MVFFCGKSRKKLVHSEEAPDWSERPAYGEKFKGDRLIPSESLDEFKKDAQLAK